MKKIIDISSLFRQQKAQKRTGPGLAVALGVVDNHIESPLLWEPRLWEPRLWEARLWEPRLWEPRLWEARLWEPRLWEPRLWEPRLAAIKAIK